MIRFWPRRPQFPVIIDTGSELFGARTAVECSRLVARVGTGPGDARIVVIDTMAEGFEFHPKMMVISPVISIRKRNWTKAEIVALFNSRRDPGSAVYPVTSLGNRSIERVVSEIVQLLDQPGLPSGPAR